MVLEKLQKPREKDALYWKVFSILQFHKSFDHIMRRRTIKARQNKPAQVAIMTTLKQKEGWRLVAAVFLLVITTQK